MSDLPLTTRLESFFGHLPASLRKHRLWVWSLYLIVMVVSAIGMARFEFSWGSNSALEVDDPIRLSLEALKNEFGGIYPYPILYRPKDGNLFSNQSLKAVKELHEELGEFQSGARLEPQALGHIIDVRSLVYTNYTDVVGDTLSFRPFVGEALPTTEGDSQRYRTLANQERDYVRTFFSKNGEYGNIWVYTDYGAIPKDAVDESTWTPEKSAREKTDALSSTVSRFKSHTLQEYVDFQRALLSILENPQYTEALEFLPPAWAEKYRKDVFEPELNLALLLALLAGALIHLLIFRSLSALVSTTVITGSSLVVTLGLAGWFNVIIDLELYIVMALILVASLADSVHVLSGCLVYRSRGDSHEKTLVSVFKKTGLACFLTSFTTALGLFSLCTIPITNIRSIGILGGVGVLIAFLVTIFMMPLLLDLRAPFQRTSRKQEGGSTPTEQPHWVQSVLRKFETLSLTYPKTVILVFLIGGAFLLEGSSHVEVNTNFSQEYKEGTPIRQAIDIWNQHFGGTGNLELLIESAQAGAFKDPRLLNMMDRLQTHINHQYPELGVNALSLVNIIKDAHQKLHENKEEEYRIPQNSNLLAQLLLLIDSGNSDELYHVVSDNFSSARVTIQLRDTGSRFSVGLVEDIQAKANQEAEAIRSIYPDIRITLTGGVPFFSKIHHSISWSQIRSYGLAFVVISLLLIGILGSLRIGLIAIIPNTFPALMTYGVMGWFNIPLDLLTLLVAPIMIGVAVDDTIHFLTHYSYAVKEGRNIDESLIVTFREVGQAIVFTTLILVTSMVFYLPISHLGISRFGALTIIAVLAALLADLFLLPALCVVFGAKSERSQITEGAVMHSSP